MSSTEEVPQTVTAEPMENPMKFATQAGYAVFFGTPEEQVIYSLILSIIAYITTALSLGATAVLVFIFTTTFFIGLTRLAYRWFKDRLA